MSLPPADLSARTPADRHARRFAHRAGTCAAVVVAAVVVALTGACAGPAGDSGTTGTPTAGGEVTEVAEATETTEATETPEPTEATSAPSSETSEPATSESATAGASSDTGGVQIPIVDFDGFTLGGLAAINGAAEVSPDGVPFGLTYQSEGSLWVVDLAEGTSHVQVPVSMGVPVTSEAVGEIDDATLAALQGAAVNLRDAVALAYDHAPGELRRVTFSADGGGPAWQVHDVGQGGSDVVVTVDATTGDVED